MPTERKVYKDSITGEFVSEADAKARPDTTFAETVSFPERPESEEPASDVDAPEH